MIAVVAQCQRQRQRQLGTSFFKAHRVGHLHLISDVAAGICQPVFFCACLSAHKFVLHGVLIIVPSLGCNFLRSLDRESEVTGIVDFFLFSSGPHLGRRLLW